MCPQENDKKKLADNLKLFQSQKQTMDAFLVRGAISRAQYDKSLKALKQKMGLDKVLEPKRKNQKP